MTRKGFIFSSIMVLLMLAASFLVTPALAQGTFDTECPICHGSGEITWGERTCNVCRGAGKIDSACPECGGSGRGKAACATCNGSGEITMTSMCPICYGEGKTSIIYIKSMSGKITPILGSSESANAHVEGVFHNEYDQGVNATVTASVELLPIAGEQSGGVYEKSVITYFPPHEDVTVKIDAEIIWVGEERTYAIYISSSEGNVHEKMITCPECNGTGVESAVTSCPDCGGTGMTPCQRCKGKGEIEVTCAECGGDGEVEVKVTCPSCGGSGYVTDRTKVSIASGIGAAAIVGLSGLAIIRRKKPTSKEKTEQ